MHLLLPLPCIHSLWLSGFFLPLLARFAATCLSDPAALPQALPSCHRCVCFPITSLESLLWPSCKVHVCMLSRFSHIRLCDTMDCSPPGSMVCGILQEHSSGLPFPSPGDLPDPGIKPASLKSPTLLGRFFTTSTTWEVLQG